MSIRRYSNLAPPLPLSVGINESAPTITVSSTFGYPEPPFILAIERGTPDEEACLCTAKTGTTFTVERGWDDTDPTDHDPGDFVEHVHSAIEFRESKIVRLTTAERDALFPEEVWDGRVIWNETTAQLEFRDAQGPGSMWSSLLPTGATIPFAGSVLPAGWLWAHGQELNRAEYPKLFEAVGLLYTYSAPNPSTFKLPNLQRKFPLGRETAGMYSDLGVFGGVMDHRHSPGLINSGGAHQHTQAETGNAGGHGHNLLTTKNNGTPSYGASHSSTAGGVAYIYGPAAGGQSSSWHVHDQLHSHTQDDAQAVAHHKHTNVKVDSAGAHSHTQELTSGVNPPYIVLNFIIKA